MSCAACVCCTPLWRCSVPQSVPREALICAESSRSSRPKTWTVPAHVSLAWALVHVWAKQLLQTTDRLKRIAQAMAHSAAQQTLRKPGCSSITSLASTSALVIAYSRSSQVFLKPLSRIAQFALQRSCD